MSAATVVVREMRASDLGRVIDLSLQLTSKDSSQRVAEASRFASRFGRIASSTDQVLLIGQEHDRVLGFIHGVSRWLLETEAYAEIQALVVDGEARRSGVGRALVERFVEWARVEGFDRVRVRSNVLRVEAHSFYPALGFERVKTQHNYERRLR